MFSKFTPLYMLLAVTAIVFGGCTSSSNGPVLHVGPDGDDAGDGSVDNPWRTLQHAVDALKPGDTVQVATGIYSGQVNVHVSGELDAPIAIEAAPGATPVIDGSEWEVGRGFSALIALHNISHVRIDGFEIRNAISTNGRRNPVGIFVSGAGTNIELRNNNIHHIEARGVGGGRDAHGIAVYGTAQKPLTNITVAGNELHDMVLGTSESLVINGNVDGFVVEDNHVHHNDNIGIDVIGFEGKSPNPELDRARNGAVRDNYVHHIDTIDNTVYGERNAGGIYVDGGIDIVIERNVVHDSNFGIEIASEDGNGDTSRVIVRNNVVFANHLAGLAMGGYDENRGRTEDCEVSGNSFVGNDTDRTGAGELLLQYDVRNNTVADNLFVSTHGKFIINEWTENEDSTFARNVYSSLTSENTEVRSPSWQWRGELYATFTSYRDASNGDGESVFVDVLLRDVEAFDFRLVDESPGSSAGATREMLELAATLASNN